MEREAVMADINRGKLKKNKAAQLLGVSRQRVTQLYAAWLKRKNAKEEKMNPAAVPAPPASLPPEQPAAPTPGDINAVLAPLGPAPAPTPPPTSAPPKSDAPPSPQPEPTPGAEQVDPEDAAAGRDLVRWFVKGFKEGLARWIFKIKKDDPRMTDIREENEFLRIAIKRNSEKAAPLGKLTRGPLGLGIGSVIESIKMAFIIGDDDGAPKDVTPHREVAKPAARETEVEEPAVKMTLDEKIASANKKAGF